MFVMVLLIMVVLVVIVVVMALLIMVVLVIIIVHAGLFLIQFGSISFFFNVTFFRMTENDRESLVNVFYNEANKGGDEGGGGISKQINKEISKENG